MLDADRAATEFVLLMTMSLQLLLLNQLFFLLLLLLLLLLPQYSCRKYWANNTHSIGNQPPAFSFGLLFETFQKIRVKTK